MNEVCRQCIIDKFRDRIPDGTMEETAQDYRESVVRIANEEETGPEAAFYIRQLRKNLFGEEAFDYSGIKRHYNALVLSKEKEITEKIAAADDRILRAMQYAMTGNYVDFGALDSVTEEQLWNLMGKADGIKINESVYQAFRKEFLKARTLTYITDNCGEVVLDMFLIRELKRVSPDLQVSVIVRGAPVANDATMEDAMQIGLPEIAYVIGNGTKTDGTILKNVSEEAHRLITKADILIAKGQANYETLRGCGLNVFYLFMCKCHLFTERFQVPQFSGVMAWEIEEC